MSMRKIFAGNWKMFKTLSEGESLVKGILAGLDSVPSEREIIVFPPFTAAPSAAGLCKGTRVSVGMQNMYWEDEGAITGEISPVMVKDAGCRYVLLGHSERRHIFGETDEDVNRKVRAALKHGIEPVLCVGELLEEREAGMTEKVIIRQLKEGLKDIDGSFLGRIIIAYEPVWAIGTGKVATPDTAQEVHLLIRKTLGEMYGKAGTEVPLLYGGSVKPENIGGLFAQNDIDGALIGGASLKAESFLAIASVK